MFVSFKIFFLIACVHCCQ